MKNHSHFIHKFVVLFSTLALANVAAADKTAADTTAKAKPAKAAKAASAAKVKDLPGIKIKVLKDGAGAEAVAGKVIEVHYTGWLQEKNGKGKKFDSSVDRGTPFSFPLGAGMVIKGWDEGVAGMKVGEKRELTISPDKGYGPTGSGGVIPPNATLIFDVELLGVKG